MFSETGFIIGEDRDSDQKTVAFFCLNAENGDVLWKDKRYEEPWWIGIEAIVHDKVYLHGYTKPDMPEHGKIVAIDLGTGKILWQNNKYAFLCATNETIYAFRDLFERRLYYELDAVTGEFIRETETPPENVYELKRLCHGRTDFSYPEILNELSADYPAITEFIARHYNRNGLRGAIEYLKSSGRMLFNFHIALDQPVKDGAEALQNVFHIVDENTGKELYDEVLNAATSAPVPDSFFVDSKIVYFVKERNTFVALPFVEIESK